MQSSATHQPASRGWSILRPLQRAMEFLRLRRTEKPRETTAPTAPKVTPKAVSMAEPPKNDHVKMKDIASCKVSITVDGIKVASRKASLKDRTAEQACAVAFIRTLNRTNEKLPSLRADPKLISQHVDDIVRTGCVLDEPAEKPIARGRLKIGSQNYHHASSSRDINFALAETLVGPIVDANKARLKGMGRDELFDMRRLATALRYEAMIPVEQHSLASRIGVEVSVDEASKSVTQDASQDAANEPVMDMRAQRAIADDAKSQAPPEPKPELQNKSIMVGNLDEILKAQGETKSDSDSDSDNDGMTFMTADRSSIAPADVEPGSDSDDDLSFVTAPESMASEDDITEDVGDDDLIGQEDKPDEKEDVSSDADKNKDKDVEPKKDVKPKEAEFDLTAMDDKSSVASEESFGTAPSVATIDPEDDDALDGWDGQWAMSQKTSAPSEVVSQAQTPKQQPKQQLEGKVEGKAEGKAKAKPLAKSLARLMGRKVESPEARATRETLFPGLKKTQRSARKDAPVIKKTSSDSDSANTLKASGSKPVFSGSWPRTNTCYRESVMGLLKAMDPEVEKTVLGLGSECFPQFNHGDQDDAVKFLQEALSITNCQVEHVDMPEASEAEVVASLPMDGGQVIISAPQWKGVQREVAANDQRYNMKAAICYSGNRLGSESGHYVTYVRNDNGTYRKIDTLQNKDIIVRSAEVDEAIKNNGVSFLFEGESRASI